MSPHRLRTIIACAAALLLFALVFLLPRVTTQREVCDAIRPGTGESGTLPARQVQWTFLVPAHSGPFNTLALVVSNPNDRRVGAEWVLREATSGRVLVRRSVRLRRLTPAGNVETFRFPPLPAGAAYTCEWNAVDRPFHLAVGAGAAGSPPAFRLSMVEDLSLAGALWRRESGRQRPIVLLLLLAALAAAVGAVLAGVGDGQATGSTRRHILCLVLAALFVSLLIGAAALAAPTTYARLAGAEDDAFITYRYARNIAAGQGFCFNPGERVLGTTTPLFTLLLALSALCRCPLPLAGALLGLASLLAAAILVYLLFRRRFSGRPALAAALLFLLFPFFYRVLGMETHLLVALVLAALYAHEQGHTAAAGLFLGLATLVRIESVLLAPLPLVVLLVRRQKEAIVRGATAFLAVVLPWFVFSWYYFGALLPNTFFVKAAAGGPGSGLGRRLEEIAARTLRGEFLHSDFLGGFTAFLSGNIRHYAFWLVLGALGLLLCLRLLPRLEFLWLYTGWGALYVLGFALLNAPTFIWYYIPALALVPLLLGAGLAHLADGGGRVRTAAALALSAAAMLFALHGIYEIFCRDWYPRHIPRLERYETYLQAAAAVHDRVPAGSTVAMEEIGIVGFSIPQRVRDLYSLVHDAQAFPSDFPLSDPLRIPYVLTIAPPDYLLLHSLRLQENEAYGSYREVCRLAGSRRDPDPGFYYVLAQRIADRPVVVGRVETPASWRRRVDIGGWVFGDRPLHAVRLARPDGTTLATARLQESSAELGRRFRFNPRAGRAAFRLTVHATALPPGLQEIQWLAVDAGGGTAVFQKDRVEVRR